MTYDLLPLLVLALLLAGTLLWFIVGAKGHWLAKSVLMVLLCLTSVNVWSAVYQFSGWPSHDELPEKFRLHWAIVQEPSTDSLGSIKLWITGDIKTPFLLKNIDTKQPRAYSIPYGREEHEVIAQGMKMIKDGKIVEISLRGKGEGEAGGDPRTPSGVAGKNKGRPGVGGNYGGPESQGGKLYILPPSGGPQKDND